MEMLSSLSIRFKPMCDRVLVMREAGSARIVFNNTNIPAEAVIPAVMDGRDIKNN